MKKSDAVQSKKMDFLVLVLLMIMAYIYCRLTVNLYIGRGLFGGMVFSLPSVLYLSLRRPKPWKKIIVSTIIFGTLFGFFFEFIQEFNQSYAVIHAVFPKLFGVVPADNVLGHTMMALLTFTFYEHFISKQKTDTVSPRIKYSLLLAGVAIVGTLGLYYIRPALLELRYSYAYLGCLAIIPPIIYAYRHPRSIGELTAMIPFFFVLYIVVELLAVKHSWWIYPGYTYIGHVTLFGATFPIEELLFWMLCYALALVSYYKIFVDPPPKALAST
jgi:hypothetical protein